ncbi:MAG TPA: hypothetical protein VFN94_11770 [Nitrospiria bacterium]|nr:hypothetical protein [Nitrospiria bacterium]
MPEHRIGLTEGLLIAGVPAAGYWFAFLYELGYCKYFDIPASFIEVSVSNILVAIVGLLGVLVLVNVYADLIFMVFQWLPSAIKSAVLRITIPVVFLTGYALVIRIPFRQVFLVLGLILVPILFLEFILPLIVQRGTRGYLAKLDAQNKSERERITVMDVVASKLGRDNFLHLALIFSISFLAYFAGGYNAKVQREFIVLPGSNELVVLKTYNASFLAAKFDRPSKSVWAEYTLVPADTQVGRFSFERVGPLQPNGLK